MLLESLKKNKMLWSFVLECFNGVLCFDSVRDTAAGTLAFTAVMLFVLLLVVSQARINLGQNHPFPTDSSGRRAFALGKAKIVLNACGIEARRGRHFIQGLRLGVRLPAAALC